MNRPHRTGLALAAASFAVVAWGCIRYVPEGESSAPPAPEKEVWTPEGADKKCFPDTVALLERADSALTGARVAEAVDFADKAAVVFKTEKFCQSDSASRVRTRTAIVAAEAALAAEGPLAAVLSLERGLKAQDSACRGATAPRCDRLMSALSDAYPGSVTRFPYFGTQPYDILIDSDTSVERLQVVSNTIEVKKLKLLALHVLPTSVKKASDGGLDLEVRGSASTVTTTAWTTVARVRFGDAVVDIRRGRPETSHFARGDLVAHVPPSDTGMVTEGEVLKILIDPKAWKRSGSRWNAGTVRVAASGRIE